MTTKPLICRTLRVGERRARSEIRRRDRNPVRPLEREGGAAVGENREEEEVGDSSFQTLSVERVNRVGMVRREQGARKQHRRSDECSHQSRSGRRPEVSASVGLDAFSDSWQSLGLIRSVQTCWGNARHSGMAQNHLGSEKSGEATCSPSRR